MNKFLTLLFVLLSIGCGKNQSVEIPSAQTLTRDAKGYYCLMTVIDHRGPKGQIFLGDQKQALWFTSVRDTIAFTLSPEEPKNILMIYVNDMTDANWDNPGEDNWIDAREAWYVLGSDHSGGMSAPEAVPFATKEKAELFASQHGGQTSSFAEIPPEYIQLSSQ